MRRYVLDASAVLTFLDNRPGADKVREILDSASTSDRPVLMSVVNWGEVYYVVWRARGEVAANQTLQRIAQLPIELNDVDMARAKLAASLKAKYGLPYADCFAAALASSRKATILTSDVDFRVLEAELEVTML